MVAIHKTVHLVGSASGMAAASAGTADGPVVLSQSPYLNALQTADFSLKWEPLLYAESAESPAGIFASVLHHNQNLAAVTAQLVKDNKAFTVFGGDHSCAIGTWSGIYSAMHDQGDLGLIWVDAHLDSHTFSTSETGNIHGMPLACLLGLGEPALTSIQIPGPKLKPEHVCVIGARSFEQGEVDNLAKLNVRIYFMEEIAERSLAVVMQEALSIVKKGTAAFGVTIDIDSIDPREAPGTGVSEPGGLSADELCQALLPIANDPLLIGTEIVEFDPHLDRDMLTEKLVARLVSALLVGKIIQN